MLSGCGGFPSPRSGSGSPLALYLVHDAPLFRAICELVPVVTARLVRESEENHQTAFKFEHLCPVEVTDGLADVASPDGRDLIDHDEAF